MVEGEESGAVCGCVCVLRGAGRSSSDRQADLRSRHFRLYGENL